MKWIKQRWRVTLRVISVLLICAGAFCGYWWLYKLGPLRSTLNPEWNVSHSQMDYWREIQRGIHRGMWSHDDGFIVGKYGDKSWAEWIMAHVKPGTSMGCMGGGPGHSSSSMRYITNQDVGENADAWLDWWAKNKSKSQQDWMEEGFRHRGLEIALPPTIEQVPLLLGLLANSETNQPRAIPSELKYNAFRCLRDSGFDAVAFAVSNRTASAEIERGLLEYSKMERLWPSASKVGILPFGRKDDGTKGIDLPMLVTPRFQATANALVFGLPLLGVAILICSFRNHSVDGGPEEK